MTGVQQMAMCQRDIEGEPAGLQVATLVQQESKCLTDASVDACY